MLRDSNLSNCLSWILTQRHTARMSLDNLVLSISSNFRYISIPIIESQIKDLSMRKRIKIVRM